MITTADIQKLAELSRIKIAPEEQESLRSQIESILGYIDQIKKVTQSQNIVPVLSDDSLRNVMREDGVPHEGRKYTEQILKTAPEREGDYLKVKKIL